MQKREGFDEAMDRFLDGVKELNATYFTKLQGFLPDTYELDPGTRYLRVWRVNHRTNGEQKSAWCFIDFATGDVFKCDGWRKPAKHPRGNIFSDRNGLEAVNPDLMCIHYLK